MNAKNLSRETLLPLLCAHILEHGLSGASLRPLAKAAGTSDRMLIYHFGNKETLISEILEYIAGIYAAALNAGVEQGRAATRKQVVERVLEQLGDPALKPFLALWWEIIAGSARGESGYEIAAERMMSRLLEWLEAHMPEDDPDPIGGARYLLTLIEGTQLLRTIGHANTARDGLLASDL
jgi:AcrR family transcriptional regulator